MIPRKCREEVLQEVHDGVAGGLLGVTKTMKKLREWFYWMNCTDFKGCDVKEIYSP